MIKNILIIISTIILLLHNVYRSYNIDSLLIQVLDVGQGDAIVIRTTDDKYILIDGGPGEVVLEQLGKVLPFWQKTFDLVIATHGDSDHISGLVEVMNRYEVKVFIYNGEDKNTEVFDELMRRADIHNVRVETARSDMDIQIGCCLSFDVLWPNISYSPELSSNDLSVGLIASYGNFDMYFAGDLSSNYEEEMLKNLPKHVEVMKLSHHGSKTSTSLELLDLLTPEKAIISVGKGNTYGHPSKNIIDSLSSRGVVIHRTDEEGIVSILTYGNTYEVNPEVDRKN